MRLGKFEAKKRIEEYKVLEARYEQQLDMLKAADPYWWFEPSTGQIEGIAKEFLRKWLKEEDIPPELDGQKDSLLSDADIVLTAGGNQSGKTTREVIEDYIDITKCVPQAMESYYPKEKIPKKTPFNIRVVGVDHKTMLNNVLPNYQYWAPRQFLKNGKWADSFSSERNLLTLYGPKLDVMGSIEFMTNQMEVESFQGPPRDKLNYDEEPRLDIHKENLMRFVTSERLRIRFNMTPTKGMTWVKDQILDRAQTEAGNSIAAFKLSSVTNLKANLAVVEEILREMSSYEEIEMRLLGEFVSLSGLVYGRLFSRNLHVIEPFPITKDHLMVRGIDPHLVKPTVCVEVAVDREDNEYVIGTYAQDKDTEEIKADLRERMSPYRTGWTMCDKSADSNLKVLGDRNVFRELSTGTNAIPALFTSEKFTGSINAGVDQIKKLLRPNERTGKPKIFFFNCPENRLIINAMETMERDIASNEDLKGIRDKINEGKHDAHAALRYIHQRVVKWIPTQMEVPDYVPDNETLNY